MHSYKVERIEQVVSEIQRKWGIDALRTLGGAQNSSALTVTSTGYSNLDETLGIGGIPRAYMTSVWGVGTSGMTTLAYSVIANAQRSGDVVVFSDLPTTFDQQYAQNYGVDFDRMLLVYPTDWLHALELTRDVIALPCTGLMVFDAGIGELPIHQHLASLPGALERLNTVLHKSRWTLLLLLPLQGAFFPDTPVALRLITKHVGWLREYSEVCGYRVQISVTKNKFRPVGQTTTIDMYVD